jgi:hypothetical protein
LAQWAVLLLLVVVVFGLLRQLGHFIVPRREELLYRGPAIDGDLPRELLTGVRPNELRTAISASRGGLGLVVALNENCSGCKALLSRIETLGSPLEAPLVAVVDSTPESRVRIAQLFDHIVDDPGGGFMRNAGIMATPFVLAVDAELRVRHHAISSAVHELMEEWTGIDTSRSSAGEAPELQLPTAKPRLPVGI